MTTFKESGMEFTFPNNWVVKKYDEHRFYHYLSGLGFKGVDMIVLTPEKKLILIEVKNYIDRFPQDGINPTETLLNNTTTFSKMYIQKFEDTFQLLRIVQKYYTRKKWYRWLTMSLQQFFPYHFLIKLDWGFWTLANVFLNQNKIHLILWLEVSPKLHPQQVRQIHQTITKSFEETIPQHSFQILNRYDHSTKIKANLLNH